LAKIANEMFSKMTSAELITIRATITIKSTQEGGRKHGFISGYRPNHVFEMPKNQKDIRTAIGDIRFDDQHEILPGETKIVTVRFLNLPAFQKYFRVGQKWFTNEGYRT
jgi:translation elongation factor EF-Tu-like GTPase